MIWVLSSLVLILYGMLGVAFVTLMERKILGLSQIRLGPNKVSFFGLLQPVADGIKLLMKDLFLLTESFSFLFLGGPMLTLALFLLMWAWVLPVWGELMILKLSSLLLFSVMGVATYAVIFTGWSSVSGFAKLGSMRGMLQSLSFEVAMILTFMIVMVLLNSIMLKSELFYSLEFLCLWTPIWAILLLMETNRAPFDLLEGESELISGFNIEMGSSTFVFLFLSEYGMIILLSFVLSLALFGSIMELGMLMVLLVMLIRSCYPRVRYDTMMSMMWQSVLPLSLSIFVFFSFLF